MKTYKLAYFAAAAAAFAVASCASDSRTPGTSPLVLEPYSYDTIVRDSRTDTLVPLANTDWRTIGSGVLPVCQRGDSAMTVLRDSLMRLARVQFDDFGFAGPLMDTGMTLTAVSRDSLESINYISNRLSVCLVTPKVAVWSNYQSLYLYGAAHGAYTTTYINYALDEGHILSLADIIVPGKEQELERLVTGRVRENPGVFPDAEITVPDNFRITDDGLEFIWPIYSIAPYAVGEVTADFAAYELAGILTPQAEALIGVPQ